MGRDEGCALLSTTLTCEATKDRTKLVFVGYSCITVRLWGVPQGTCYATRGLEEDQT